MTESEARKIPNGIYRIWWKDGGSSLAAKGCLTDGTPWFAPINWQPVNEDGVVKPGAHRMISFVEAIPIPPTLVFELRD